MVRRRARHRIVGDHGKVDDQGCGIGTATKAADRCVQVMGGRGVSDDSVVEQIFREIRCFRIYDGPTEVHKWSLAKRIKRQWWEAQA